MDYGACLINLSTRKHQLPAKRPWHAIPTVSRGKMRYASLTKAVSYFLVWSSRKVRRAGKGGKSGR